MVGETFPKMIGWNTHIPFKREAPPLLSIPSVLLFLLLVWTEPHPKWDTRWLLYPPIICPILYWAFMVKGTIQALEAEMLSQNVHSGCVHICNKTCISYLVVLDRIRTWDMNLLFGLLMHKYRMKEWIFYRSISLDFLYIYSIISACFLQGFSQ